VNVAHDLAVFKLMVAELKDYLLADVPFWQMQAPSSFPKLSLGLLLLTQARLEAADALLDAAQRAERNAAARQLDATLGSWQVAAETRAARELRTRLNLWQRFWEECGEQPRTCAENYANEVTQRVIAGLLLHQFPRVAAAPEAAPLEALDRQVRARLRGDRFVWPAELQAGFPAAAYWYLYGLPAT
jgi:hypothetical protein